MTLQAPISPDLPSADRIDWRPVLRPSGPWSTLVHSRSGPAVVAGRCPGIAYVACPYGEESKVRQAWRIERSVRVAAQAAIEVARLAVCGCTAICPVLSVAEISHARLLIGEDAPDPLDARFWSGWSQPLFTASAVLVVPDISGWDRCPSVWRDLCQALAHNMPVHVYGGASA